MTREPGRIAIFDADPDGHRFFYVRTIVRAARVQPTVFFTSDEGLTSPEFAVHLADLEKLGQLHAVSVGSRYDRSTLFRKSLVRNALSSEMLDGVETLVIPEADRLLSALCAHALGRLGHGLPRLRLLLMRSVGPRLPTNRDRLRADLKILLALLVRVAWPKSTVFFLTDAFGVVARRPGYPFANPIRDPATELPTESRSTARAVLGLAENAFVAGMFGDLGDRKNPGLLINAGAALGANAVVLLAGRPEPSITPRLRGAQHGSLPGQLMWIGGYLSDEMLGRCISAVDVVALLHSFDAPSGTLASAVRAGKPVVVAGSPWLITVVEKLGLGVVAELSVDSVADALRDLQSHADRYEPALADAATLLDAPAFGRLLAGTP